jgi:hypothetical protein
MFEASVQMAMSSRRIVQAGMAQGGLLSPVLFSLYFNTPSLSHHVELAHYADDTAIIAMSLKPTLLISYLESTQRPSMVVERMENRH